MTITKASLINAICNNSNIPRQESSSAVESLLEIIKQTLASGENILISGFGKFCLKDKRERRGRNPQTGDAMMMDARRIVTFKCSNLMRDKINGKG
jgi:integration host factor subunit alpha